MARWIFFLDFLGAPPYPCSLLSEKTSVRVSITAVRPWGCPTCQECASLTGVVTSTKTLDSPWLSQLLMNSDTGKGPRKLRPPPDHASVSGFQENQIALWLENHLLNLCFLICKMGGEGRLGKDTSSRFHCLLCPDHLYHQHQRIIETSASLWVRMRRAETRR